jgi:starch synthase
MKGGIVFSDLVNTVSKKYADEIQTEEFGCRLDGLLRYVSSQGRLRGILNGLDYSEFNSETDRRISHNYSAGDAEGKWVNKADLQRQVGLPEKENVPLFGLVSRLVDQKGLDLIKAAMPKFMEMDVQFVLLGTGEPAYEAYFKEVEAEHPDKMSAQIGFDVVLAQKIYAGCDVFLMPSRYEPCGLGQMISLRYGTIPLVRATGGLADTIDEFDPSNMSGNGFVFSEYTEDAFFDAVKRSVSTYQSPEKWRGLISNAMACDFSCGSSANEYLTYYNSAVELGRKRAAA